MKCYPPTPDYVRLQRNCNWKHTNGEIVSQGDRDKAQKSAYYIRDTLTPDLKYILVLGCRAGYEGEALADTFDALVVGVDIVPEFIDMASRCIPALCADIHSLEFPDNSFDLIFCEGTLEHCYEPMDVLREMYRVVKKYVYLSVDLEEDRGTYKSHFSFSSNPDEWLDKYETAGFNIKEYWIEAATGHDAMFAVLEKEIS